MEVGLIDVQLAEIADSAVYVMLSLTVSGVAVGALLGWLAVKRKNKAVISDPEDGFCEACGCDPCDCGFGSY